MRIRLDLALIKLHPDLSRRRARDVIEKGQVTVGGQTTLESGLLVEPTAQVAWYPNLKARSRVRSSIRLLHEDEDVLVVDKPAGLLAVPSAPDARDEDTALARVQEYITRLRPRRPYVGVVHRLDRDTSGALAFALSPPTRAALRDLFRAHRMERRYAALVEGVPSADEGQVDAPIYDVYEAGRRRLARPGEPAHEARTRWRVVERFRAGALLEVELETGRQHQIRLHLAHLGLPIVGDHVYSHASRWWPQRGRSARLTIAAPRQMLHARHLAFVHPVTGARVEAESPLPADFRATLAALRRVDPARDPAPPRARPARSGPARGGKPPRAAGSARRRR